MAPSTGMSSGGGVSALSDGSHAVIGAGPFGTPVSCLWAGIVSVGMQDIRTRGASLLGMRKV